MAADPVDPLAANRALSGAIRGVRVLRGLRTSEIAGMMGINKRSYERFERCDTLPDLERILRFARVTKSDAAALLMAVATEEPAIGPGAADNKLCQIQASALKTFTREVGGLGDLDSVTIMLAVSQMYEDLAGKLQKRSAMLAQLLGSSADTPADIGHGPPPIPASETTSSSADEDEGEET